MTKELTSPIEIKIDLPQFTGLRGIAALLVLFYHVRTPQDLELHFGFLDAFSRFGFLGVDVFFVLSGFILTHVYGASYSGGVDRPWLWRYGLARFSRIYPLHFVTLFMMLCAYAVAVRAGVQPVVTSGYTEKNVILTLLLVQEWFGEVAPNPSSWSISIEFASYLIFPLLISRLAGVRGAWPLAIILIGAFGVDKLAGVRVARGVIEFVIGCAVYSVSKRYEGGAFRALAAIAFIVPFAAAELAGRELAGLSALCFAATLFLLAGTGAEPFKRLCSTRAAVFFGDISYSVYLLQWFVWIGWKHIIARTPFFAERPYVMVLCAAASLILCATVSYRFFEKPARSWLRKLSRPKIDRDAPRKDRGVRAV